MCGICGIWGKQEVNLVEQMLDNMAHRGPDDRGIFSGSKGVLGHNRLSIMDPRHGKQPIYNEDNTKAVVANGEIYNFPELYRKLSASHRFTTKNDSESLVHLYEDSHKNMVGSIDGMYTFCIADAGNIFLARDPIGIKPLYFGECHDGSILFSSELKSFDSLNCTIREFPPGTLYHSETGFETYYEVPSLQSVNLHTEAHAENVRKTLEESVCKRLMSDVPLGTFLSGGLDSSLISALTARQIDGLHTFSVGFEGSQDPEAARVVATHIGSNHHEYVLSEKEVIDTLPEIIYHLESFDQDLVRSAVPCYFTSKIASEYVKVILTGEGADELFGGYTYYKDIADEEDLHRELRRSVSALHNVNLQRVDRLTMAHSIEGRVPFLDLKMIEMAQRVPVSLKLKGTPSVEKWILRMAFQDELPSEILWRDKAQFDEGTGMSRRLPALIDRIFSDEEGHTYQLKYPDTHLRSKEEAFYFKLFMECFSSNPHVLQSVGRWADRPNYH